MAVSTSNISRDEARLRSSGLDVTSYHTTLDIRRAPQPEVTRFGVHCVLEFDSRLERTFVDFLDGVVHEVLVDGEPQQVDYDGTRFWVDLTPGHTVLEVRGEATYSRSGQGLHRFVDPVDGACYLYTQFEPSDARRVFPCFEQPDLKAAHHVTVLAPAGWVVRSNQPEVACDVLREEQAPQGVRHVFAPTPRLSTYLTCVAAGPWHEVRGHWESGDGLEVELGALCRRSLAEHFDAEAVLEVTRQGMDFYHRNFGFAYPWGKYDQVFVPEYNLGAMENPGLVTFTEGYVPRSAATRAQYQARANTILHEMAHMWFGDLVTPAWWDDLWLKESFAEYMGAQASVEATEFTDAWVAFAGRRKAWAYLQDQLPTTHPIVADIPDVEAAKQNFDGITYAKGAAVLKQLVAHVGREAFFAGARDYFREHAFGSATLADLLRALEAASGRDLGAWSRAWLQTAGPDTLTPVVEADGGRIVRLGIQQHSTDARDGSRVGRPHTLVVGLYDLQDGALRRTDRLEVELDGSPTTWLDELPGRPVPALALVNDEDLTYAKVRLDEGSLGTVLEHLGSLADPLARALLWSSLWDMTRDAVLPVDDYLGAVLRHGTAEADVATLTDVLDRVDVAIERYLPQERREQTTDRVGDAVLQRLREAEPGSDRQLVLARSLARLALRSAALTPTVRALLSGTAGVDGLEVGNELRWMLLRALAAHQEAGEQELDAELQRDPAADGVTAHRRALASRPVPAVKEQVWQELHTPLALSNDHVDALVEGLRTRGQQDLVAGYAEPYFEGLEQVWGAHAIEIAQRLVEGLFPAVPGSAERAERWLQEHPQAPSALRRLVLEGADDARRAERAQAFNRGASRD